MDFRWFKLPVILFFLHHTDSVFRPKCMVHDSTRDHPERPRMPPQNVLVSSDDVISRRTVQSVYGVLSSQCRVVYDVPVVWHVITNSSGHHHVSNQTIKDAMQVLNDGFMNSTFHFRLYSIDRHTNDKWSSMCVQKKSVFKHDLAVSPATVLNVYTCPFDINDDIVGDASLPWSNEQDSVYNGVVIHPETLPNGSLHPWNEGGTLVHEVGHYFGLLHYFGSGTCAKDADMVNDTPVSKHATYKCDAVDTCRELPGLDPIHNYMGYVNDSCLYEFTPGQIARMSWILDTYKDKLKSVVHKPCNIDSVFRWSNRHVYFFSRQSYYRYNETSHGIDADYPRPINEFWKGVPNNIDGVFRYSNGLTYFFKGFDYYRFNDSTLQVDPGYPKKISDFWKGVPNDIDDVIRYSNGHTYFFKDGRYYRFNSTTKTVDGAYPRPMQQYWVGIPAKINAAFTWHNGGVYFFYNSQFWLFKPSPTKTVIKAPYPQSINIWWNDTQLIRGYSVFRHCNGYTYFFSGEQYWRYDDLSCSADLAYPLRLSSWRGMPRRIDDVFVWSNGYLYVFSGTSYYRFNQTSQSVEPGYPRNIASFWKGVPNNIDAVFRCSNGLTYFFKGSLYYRFNDTKLQVDTGYPKPTSSFWKGVPNNLDTVFRWSNGQTYFFKGSSYYQFNFTKGAVDDGYPRHVSAAWKGVLYNPGGSAEMKF